MNKQVLIKHTVGMKKALILLVSLLSISSLTVFAGCNQNGGDGNASAQGKVTRLVVQDDGAETPDTAPDETPGEGNDGDVCPDRNCKKGMPKVKFGHKYGRPAAKETETEEQEKHVEHRAERGPRHKKPRPTPPADGENGN